MNVQTAGKHPLKMHLPFFIIRALTRILLKMRAVVITEKCGRFFCLGLAIILILAIGCGDDDDYAKGFDDPPVIDFDECISYQFEIDSLPYNRLANISFNEEILRDTNYLKDDEGVIMSEINGLYYYHPVAICHRALALGSAYRATDDPFYLDLLLKHVDRLLAESMEYDGAVYFPYRFDYHVNQQEDGLLTAPWFSGMAQGEALSVLVRTFQVTGDSTWLDHAHHVFKSFQRLHGDAEPWTVFVDTQGCYWIEEYPVWEPSMTLNGFIYAVYGLYEYYLLTGSEQAEDVLQASLSTIKNYIPVFRRPGGPSFYGLRFGHYSAQYHMIHISQLKYLYKVTGDSYFLDWADTLYLDYSG